MAASALTLALLGASLILAASGTLATALDEEWDLLVVFAMLLALVVALAATLRVRRPPVPVRADLVAWLTERSALSGESIEVLVDRAIAAYRAGLGDLDDRHGSARRE